MNFMIDPPFIKKGIILGVVLCLLVTGYSLLRYPGILLPLRAGILLAAILIVVLVIYTALVLHLTRTSDSNAVWLARRGFNWGLVITGFWLIEIVAGNLLDPKYSLVKLIYFGSSVFAFSLPLFAGIEGAKQTGLIPTGALIGLWSGIISGLLTFLCLMLVTYLFLNTSLQDPQNLIQFKGSGAQDLVTFVIGDSLAGGIGHLIIGLILCPGFGAIGGLMGTVFTSQTFNSTT